MRREEWDRFLESQFVEETEPAAAKEQDGRAPVQKAGRAGRARSTRAPHIRNIPPAASGAGIEAAGMLSRVPVHLQTLLALEREEDGAEVAQGSYKRQFSESRRELIERLIDPLLTLEEAARLLSVCPTTVRRYTNRGLLSFHRKTPQHGDQPDTGRRETRQRRFRLSDILAFLEAQRDLLNADALAARNSRVRSRARGSGGEAHTR